MSLLARLFRQQPAPCDKSIALWNLINAIEIYLRPTSKTTGYEYNELNKRLAKFRKYAITRKERARIQRTIDRFGKKYGAKYTYVHDPGGEY